MEDIPPSYDQSTNPSVLELIASYLDTRSLHALTLVSRTYNAVFMPQLWGSPASHFVPVTGPTTPGLPRGPGNEASYDDMVYVALTRFKRIIKIARLPTRSLVHTLYLPAAASEIYSGPNGTWLRELLDWLPNLQSLCVSNLPFFDHTSLTAVERNRQSQPGAGRHVYPVKLLLAAKEFNATSIGLAGFLPHLPRLVYLDLSFTSPARDRHVLASLGALPDLQILKLRGIGLRDPEAEVLANAIGLRVRLLDLADNKLGDMAIRSLLQACFMHPSAATGQNGNRPNGLTMASSLRPDLNPRRHLESWPVGLPPAPDFLSLDTLRSADFDKNLLTQLTNPLTGRLAFEDIPHGGITHLYITGNPGVTVEGVKSLLEVGRLHVLDAGHISGETAVDRYVRSMENAGMRHGRSTRTGSIRSNGSHNDSLHGGTRSNGNDEEITFSSDDMHLPGAEKLVPVLREKASKNLTFLRVEHKLITKEFDVTKERDGRIGPRHELPATKRHPTEMSAPSYGTERVEAPGSNYQAVEMPVHSDVYELDSAQVFRAELPGDPIHFAISPPVGERPGSVNGNEVVTVPVRGEGPFAPEVVNPGDNPEEEVVLDASGFGLRRGPGSPVLSASLPLLNGRKTIDSVIANGSGENGSARVLPPTNDRRSQIQTLLKLRPISSTPKLHPASLPNLRTLVLTNLPAQVKGKSSPILTSIKEFISACATEAYIAVLRAQTNYSLPPGRARIAAEQKHVLSLFALRTIVLEVSPIQESTQPRDWKHTRQRLNISKSSTGDHDSEALWSAAVDDFSFFGEAGEEHDECGIYDYEPGKYFPSVYLNDKFVVSAEDSVSSASGTRSGHSTLSSLGRSSPTGALFRSPQELPLGRNKGSNSTNRISSPDSASFSGGSGLMELPGSIPTSNPRPSVTARPVIKEPAMVDLIVELAAWRKERKAAFEEEVRRRTRVNGVTRYSDMAERETHVEGHWKGKIEVVRNAAPIRTGSNRGQSGRMERNGMVDIYGNYFEKGYLYS